MTPQATNSPVHTGRVRANRKAPPEEVLRQLINSYPDIHAPFDQPTADRSRPLVLIKITVNECQYTLSCSYCGDSSKGTQLSPRESEIVRLVAKGLPNKVIADVLEISTWTVATHLRRIFAKIGVSSRAEMVARAIDQRFV